MKRPHLLTVSAPPAAFAPLVEAIRTAGLRVGWLDLDAPPAALEAGAGGDLETAAGLGVLRAVAAGGGRTVALKPLVGEPVLDDLLREHFRGCALVLVRGGEVEAPVLAADADGWKLRERRLTTAELVARLRRPHGFST